MTLGVPEKHKEPRRWRPLWTIETRNDAVRLARFGVLVCGYIGCSYVYQIIFIHFTEKKAFGDSGNLIAVWAFVGVVLAVFLAWRIWNKQEFWATVFLALWWVIEMVGRVEASLTNSILMMLLTWLTGFAMLSLRGSWKLRQERRSGSL